MLDWLLNYAVHSTILLGAAWMLSTRTRSHLVKETLWKTALFGGFLTATAQSVVGVGPIAGRIELASLVSPSPSYEAVGKYSAVPTEAPVSSDRPTVAASGAVGESALPKAAARSIAVQDVVLVVWLVGAVVLVGSYLVRRALLSRRIAARRPVMTHPLAEMVAALAREAGITRPIRLTVSAGLPSPVALGSSEIAVPQAALTELDPEQQRGMLAHELAHLERRDPAWLAATSLAERIAFFQPLNRMARRRIQESAEYLCDEWAVRRTGSGVFLAKCLAKVAEWMDASPSAVPVAGMAEERSHLVARVRRLLDNAPFPAAPRRRTMLAGAVLVVIAATLAVPGISLGRQDAGGKLRAFDSEEGSGRAQGDTSRAVIRGLMEASRDSDVEVRRAALRSLANYQDPGTVGIFREALRDSDAEIRATAVHALAELKDRGSVSAIAALLRDENVELRRRAADALGELPAAGARTELIAAVKDTDAEVREGAIRALARLKDPAAVAALTEALKDSKADVRARAIEALHEMELDRPPEGLLEALRDPSAEVRHEAAHAVGHYQDVRAVPALRAMLEDPNAEVREAAVEALAEIRNDAAIDALVAALKSKDPKVRRAAADALGQR